MIITIKSFLTRPLLLLTMNSQPVLLPLNNAITVPIDTVSLGGTPLKALKASTKETRFPQQEESTKHPQKKPETGRYHVVRFIKSDKKLNVFGDIFLVPSELEYEYVVATIDVKEQKLKLYLDKTQVAEFAYKLRN